MKRYTKTQRKLKKKNMLRNKKNMLRNTKPQRKALKGRGVKNF